MLAGMGSIMEREVAARTVAERTGVSIDQARAAVPLLGEQPAHQARVISDSQLRALIDTAPEPGRPRARASGHVLGTSRATGWHGERPGDEQDAEHRPGT